MNKNSNNGVNVNTNMNMNMNLNAGMPREGGAEKTQRRTYTRKT